MPSSIATSRDILLMRTPHEAADVHGTRPPNNAVDAQSFSTRRCSCRCKEAGGQPAPMGWIANTAPLPLFDKFKDGTVAQVQRIQCYGMQDGIIDCERGGCCASSKHNTFDIMGLIRPSHSPSLPFSMVRDGGDERGPV